MNPRSSLFNTADLFWHSLKKSGLLTYFEKQGGSDGLHKWTWQHRSALVIAPRKVCAITLSAAPWTSFAFWQENTGLLSVTVIAPLADAEKSRAEYLNGF